MKTTDQIKSEISQLRNFSSAAQKVGDIKKCKSIKSQLLNLNFCLLYLNTNPKKESLERQLTNVTKQIEVFENRYGDWLRTNSYLAKNIKNTMSYYENLNNLPKLREQAEMLKYLID
jgi:hypothetical protein